MKIDGLRSPYETVEVEGLVHFGRMIDKIRISPQGTLPPAWAEAKGGAEAFDGICGSPPFYGVVGVGPAVTVTG
ncbi:MAG: DUF5069 domain-containing protein [Verrucomicrobia bacterium]|nr:DUF5069 domain-containing protein [Verrucomicrobiota bacterium]